jgi:putative SOS response-associated peptidase YedK
MPAILDSPSDVETWLSNRPFDDKVKSLVKPFGGRLEFYPVDKGVGKVGNDSRDFIKVKKDASNSLISLGN